MLMRGKWWWLLISCTEGESATRIESPLSSLVALVVTIGVTATQRNDLPPSMKNFFYFSLSDHQSCCWLIVASSDSLPLLALHPSRSSQSLCACHIKGHLSERERKRSSERERKAGGEGGGGGGGVVEQLYLLCSCWWLYLLGLFVCFSSSGGEVEGSVCGSLQNSNSRTPADQTVLICVGLFFFLSLLKGTTAMPCKCWCSSGHICDANTVIKRLLLKTPEARLYS